MIASEKDANMKIELIEDISKAMQPIFGINSEKLEYLGTSFCLNHKDTEYLITASHVLAGKAGCDLRICVNGRMQSIPSDKSANFKHENVDVYVARLTHKICQRSLRINTIDSFSYCKNQHALIGYPNSRFSVNSRTSKYELRVALSTPALDTGINLPDSKVHFACPFYRKNALFANGMRGIFAEPHGMSGGLAVFLYESADNSESLGFAGVITDLHNGRKPYIRCTRSEIILEAIGLIENNQR